MAKSLIDLIPLISNKKAQLSWAFFYFEQYFISEKGMAKEKPSA